MSVGENHNTTPRGSVRNSVDAVETPRRRRTIYESLEDARLDARRAKRSARWLAESRDYWRERARAAEWGLRAATKRGRS